MHCPWALFHKNMVYANVDEKGSSVLVLHICYRKFHGDQAMSCRGGDQHFLSRPSFNHGDRTVFTSMRVVFGNPLQIHTLVHTTKGETLPVFPPKGVEGCSPPSPFPGLLSFDVVIVWSILYYFHPLSGQFCGKHWGETQPARKFAGRRASSRSSSLHSCTHVLTHAITYTTFQNKHLQQKSSCTHRVNVHEEIVVSVVDRLEQPRHLPKCPPMDRQQEHHPRNDGAHNVMTIGVMA